jgi:hypothetical protein
MEIVAAYEQVGTNRGAAVLCGTTHKTVPKVIEAHRGDCQFLCVSGRDFIGWLLLLL